MKQYIIILSILAALSMEVVAQPPGPPGGRRGMERIEQLRKVRLVEILDLKEDQSVRFFARLNDHENAKRALLTEKTEVLDRIDRLVRNEADAKEFEKLFLEVEAIDTKLSELQKKFFAGLSDLLTPQQRGKFLLFERQFERELREAMKDVQRRRFRPDSE